MIWQAVMFLFLLSGAGWDYRQGKVPVILLILPILVLGAMFPATFVFPFMVMTTSLITIKLLVKKHLGTGDVLAIPLAFSISFLAHPFYGPVAFALVLAAEIPFLHRNKEKTLRFLPWLVIPTATAMLTLLI